MDFFPAPKKAQTDSVDDPLFAVARTTNHFFLAFSQIKEEREKRAQMAAKITIPITLSLGGTIFVPLPLCFQHLVDYGVARHILCLE